MTTFDAMRAFERLADFEVAKRRADEALKRIPLSHEDAATANHYLTTDWAPGLAESLRGALDLLNEYAAERLDAAGLSDPTMPRTTATLTRDIDVAASTAARSRELAAGQAHPAVAGELRHAGGFAEGVAAYARLVRDGEMSDELAKLLDI